MECKVGRLRYLYWESHLVQMMELREAPPMGCQVEIVLENLRIHQWESHLIQNMELR